MRLLILVQVDLDRVSFGGQFLPLSTQLLDLCVKSLLKLRLRGLRVLLELGNVLLETLLSCNGSRQFLLASRDGLLQLADLILTTLL